LTTLSNTDCRYVRGTSTFGCSSYRHRNTSLRQTAN